MDPKSALFLRATIMRIHCKKQGLGGGPFIIRYAPKSSFFFLCKKTVFSQPSISPRREAYFSGLRTMFFTFLCMFFYCFFRGQFWSYALKT